MKLIKKSIGSQRRISHFSYQLLKYEMKDKYKQINYFGIVNHPVFMHNRSLYLSPSRSSISNSSKPKLISNNNSELNLNSPLIKKPILPLTQYYHTLRDKSRSISGSNELISRKSSQKSSIMKPHKQSAVNIRIQEPLEQIPRKCQQNVAIFVQEVISDPSLLHKLIDFKMLIHHYKQKALNQQQIVAQKKVVLQNEYEKYYELFGKQYKTINSVENSSCIQTKRQKLMSQLIKIDSELRKINEEERYYVEIHEKKQEIIERAIHDLKNQLKEKHKEHLLDHARHTNKLNLIIKKIAQQKKQVKNKNFEFNKLKQRVQELNSLRKRIEDKKKMKEQKKKQYEQLKKVQMEELKKYKANMMTKSNTEKENKKKSEKKLNEFVSEIVKIIEHGQVKKFYEFAKNYNVAVNNVTDCVRRKNSTTDSIPDINEIPEVQNNHISMTADEQNQKCMSQLEEQNPMLKKISNEQMTAIKKIEESQYYRKLLMKKDKKVEYSFSEQEYSKELESKEKAINELMKEQNELNSFIEELRKRADQKNKELVESEIEKKVLKKSLSLLS